MGNDPNQPGYEAQYSGNGSGAAGSGRDFGADLFVLYAAGRVHLPNVAQTYATLTTNIHNLQPVMARCAETSPGYLEEMLVAREDLQVAFLTTSKHLSEAAQALVEIADDYVRTDEAAAAEFNECLKTVATAEEKEQFNEPTQPPPSPPDPTSPHQEIEPSPHGPMPEPGEN